ncbi:unnamed protein product [Agarophyton chilense]|eukprot:gb/GEZJ01004336.1/.p1 GENE.gb/GEZJ01004336.1/~~gb/GEZJ01004336.1/.p1  ORF type:complete len:383 (-),score=32.28 gb/GEZJ01004336.1/:2652-3800(-)
MERARERCTVPKAIFIKDTRKALTDRLHAVTKLLTSLTLAEHVAIREGDTQSAANARMRWNDVYRSHNIVSPFADAYRNGDAQARHANKSVFLSALRSSTGGTGGFGLQARQEGNQSVGTEISYYYDFVLPQYVAVMIDLMNNIWSRDTDGRRRNSLFKVTVLKLKNFFRPWFTGKRSEHLAQIHLHIESPPQVIPQKMGEQERRDKAREPSSGVIADADLDIAIFSSEEDDQIGFHVPITVPWSRVIGSPQSRDSICSLDLFCGAAAAMELVGERGLDVSIFRYGGCFCFTPSCFGKKVSEVLPELAVLCSTCLQLRHGEVMLSLSSCSHSVDARTASVYLGQPTKYAGVDVVPDPEGWDQSDERLALRDAQRGVGDHRER